MGFRWQFKGNVYLCFVIVRRFFNNMKVIRLKMYSFENCRQKGSLPLQYNFMTSCFLKQRFFLFVLYTHYINFRSYIGIHN